MRRAIIIVPSFYKPVVLAAGLAASSVSWTFNAIFQSFNFSHPLVTCILGIISAIAVVLVTEHFKSKSAKFTQLNLASDTVAELTTRERGRYESLIQTILENEIKELQAEVERLETRLAKYEPHAD